MADPSLHSSAQQANTGNPAISSSSANSSQTVLPPHPSIRHETSSRRLRNQAVEYQPQDLSTASRPISTSTADTARHDPFPVLQAFGGPLLGAHEPDEVTIPAPTRTSTSASPTRPPRYDAIASRQLYELDAPSPIRGTDSPVYSSRPDAPLLDADNFNRFDFQSPAGQHNSTDGPPHSPHHAPRSLATSPFSESEADMHQHFTTFPIPPHPSEPVADTRHTSSPPPPFASTSSFRPPKSRADNNDALSVDEAQPPDFRRRSASSQHNSERSRRSRVQNAPSHGSPRRHSRASTSRAPTASLHVQLVTYSYLMFFSIFGTLARLGLQWLTFYPGAPIATSTLWANFAGSLFMGFLSEDKRLFGQSDTPMKSLRYSSLELKSHDRQISPAQLKKTIPLYIGLAVGFCGSFTSFSSFERDVFLALANRLPTSYYHPSSTSSTINFGSTIPRNGGYSFLALLAVIIAEIGLSLAALFVGAHLAILSQGVLPSLTSRPVLKAFDYSILILGPGSWIGALFLVIFPPDRTSGVPETWRGTVLFSILFAPIGCMLRYVVSLRLNSITPSFPLGTFSVNIFGCAVLAMCYNIQHVRLASSAIGGGLLGCQALQGIMDGFCGCLTTVSTFVLELTALMKLGSATSSRRRNASRGIRSAWIYGVSSVVVGACIMIIVMGSVLWTAGWSPTACATMRTTL